MSLTQGLPDYLRWSPVVAVTLAIVFVVSSSSHNRPVAALPISPLSQLMQQQGDQMSAVQNYDQAIGYYEASLVADPRNADAFVGLGKVAQAQSLPGKAIGQYRAALSLRPDDRHALALQGQALVARGAMVRARANLARLQELCRAEPCAEVAQLAEAVSGRPTTVLSAEAVRPQPTITPTRPSN